MMEKQETVLLQQQAIEMKTLPGPYALMFLTMRIASLEVSI